MGGVTKHRIRRQDQPPTTNHNPTTTGQITQIGAVAGSLLGDGSETEILSPTIDDGTTDSNGGIASTADLGLQGSGPETGNPIATTDGDVILTTNGVVITLSSVTEIPTPARSSNDSGFITELPVTVTVSSGTDLPVSQYLSTFLAILLAMLSRIIDTDFKRMEPYYELSRSRDLDRPDSLCKRYLFYNAAVVPQIASYRGQVNGPGVSLA
ncbi:hypothetical protein BDD12DRAFT_806008 [Trichophaea hybrida]|nr:hypothetical protein BDD12DRAFT_806008 [Trichophaea hybrida]